MIAALKEQQAAESLPFAPSTHIRSDWTTEQGKDPTKEMATWIWVSSSQGQVSYPGVVGYVWWGAGSSAQNH